jgi:transposase
MQPCAPTKGLMLGDNSMTDKLISGVDVSKDWLDLAVAGNSKVERIDNTQAAIECWLKRVQPGLVAFEPTGGYERVLQRSLRALGILFVRVHPNEVIAYRKSRGIKAKTDRIDARLIADFAVELQSRRGLKIDIAGNEALREAVIRRRQIRLSLHAENCRFAIADSKTVRKSIRSVIVSLNRNLKAIEAEIADQIKSDPQAREISVLLRTITGIGPIGSATLVADLPELGHLSGKQVAALIGLAPGVHQSGKTSRPGHTGYGRPAVRSILFNAARAAIRHPSHFKTFYDHLVNDNHRPGKVALVAVMRKILVTANAVARDRQPCHLAKA